MDDKAKEMAHLRQMATLKELGAFKEMGDIKEITTPKGKKQERNIYIVKQTGKDKSIYIVMDQAKGKELRVENVLGAPERKMSMKQMMKEKEAAKAKEMRKNKQGVKKKSSQESEKKDPKDSDMDTNREESTSGSETAVESEKTDGSEGTLVGGNGRGDDDEEEIEEEEEDEDEDEEEEEEEEEESEKEKNLANVMIEEEEEEDDVPVEIDQSVTTSIASTVRKGATRPKLTFFIKPRKGMTANLANRIREHEKQNEIHGFPRGRELEIKCLIEGAYGVNHPLHLYETVVLIAGGVGITTILPYLCDYMERSRGPERRTLTRRLVFLWTAKEEELVENLVAKKFPKGCLTRSDISMQLFITKNKDGQKKLPGVKYKRPKIGDILRSEQKRLVGRMSILSCGPSVLVDIVRSAVVDCLDAERKHIEYFEESY